MYWPPRELANLERRLDELIRLTRTNDRGVSDEIRGWLARLLVVRSCGYLEQVANEVFRSYIDAKSGGMVRSFARSWLERSNNPTPKNLLEAVGRFDALLQQDLYELLEVDDQRLHREISFLVDRRNKIAHGLNEGITPSRALLLSEAAKEVADWFILRMNPLRVWRS